MNERIKQLAEQARQYYLTLPTGFNPENVGMYPQLMEKFAELIVQECLEACSRANEIRHFVPPGQQQVVLDCMREIEETFRS